MNSTAPIEKIEADLPELWKQIPYVSQVEIDLAADKGNKAEAVNRCMCSVKGLDMLTAQRLVEHRHNELRK